VLIDGDAVIYESAIINEYLEEKYPQIPLMPKDPLRRSRARIWIDYCNTRLQHAGGKIAHDFEVEKSAEELKKYLATLNSEMEGRQYIVGIILWRISPIFRFSLEKNATRPPSTTVCHT